MPAVSEEAPGQDKGDEKMTDKKRADYPKWCCKVLAVASQLETPEQRLSFAVLEQAVRDYLAMYCGKRVTMENYQSAAFFLHSQEECKPWLEAVGLDHAYMISVIRDTSKAKDLYGGNIPCG